MRNEIKRKLIHILSIIFPAAYLLRTKQDVLFILGIAVIFAISVELGRFFCVKFAKIFDKTVGHLLRFHEKQKFTSATNLLLSFYVSTLIFSKPVAVSVMLFVVLCDALSALVGKKWGNTVLYGNKTLEGSAVFLLSGLIIILIVPGLDFLTGLFGLVAAFVVDLFVVNIDDNITIPIVSGVVMQIVLFL
ncbi:hypothetical protein DRQ07_00935 [candidate division KSB1 bacterium]|nr:MAG: hypothetical protein DRQ07_00935 [candidate division KSB1 bacterium]